MFTLWQSKKKLTRQPETHQGHVTLMLGSKVNWTVTAKGIIQGIKKNGQPYRKAKQYFVR